MSNWIVDPTQRILAGALDGLALREPAVAANETIGTSDFASELQAQLADSAKAKPATVARTNASTTMFPITHGMTAQQRAAVYVARLTYAKAHGGLTAVQQNKLAKYSATARAHPGAAMATPAVVAAGTSTTAATTTATAATTSTATAAAASTLAPAAPTAPGTISQVDGQTYINLGSYTGPSGAYFPDGLWISLASPSSDTFGLLQQLLAVQRDPSLLAGSPLAAYTMFSDPAQRAAQIAQLGGSILASGPAYYGKYSGLSGAQIQQIAEAAQTAEGIHLNPALAAAIAQAAATAPADAPATVPLATASIAQAASNVSTINEGSYGLLSVSSLPAGTLPQYAGATDAGSDGGS
jgi:hypothetical protein